MKLPARELVNVTVPVGVTGGPWPVSVTVAEQLTGRPIVTLDGQQNTDVVVCRCTSGLIAIPYGPPAIGIGVPGVPVASAIGVTMSSLNDVTYAVWPSGVIAIAWGDRRRESRSPACS